VTGWLANGSLRQVGKVLLGTGRCIDDHEVVRRGLRGLIDAEPDLVVMGEADTGGGALRFLAQTPIEVLVLDLDLPDMSGIDVLQQLSRCRSLVRVLVLSSLSAEQCAADVLRAGAAEYVCKGDGARAILEAIRRIVASIPAVAKIH
jgi:DNA-binding NarL/FixJ family response regulator